MYNDPQEELDVTKLKYVLYARKSTDDPKRQVRSIPDQIAECRELAARFGLHIVGPPLTEERSAKRPGRPVFGQMIKAIKDGKYDAILAWHPDRLARNMREGGALIDLIDEEVIKDLKFVAHTFSPDPSGKMLLGMAFVLSKEYSDRLSVNVKRGVRRLHQEEGKTPAPKYGYVNEDGVYRPDSKNFELIVEAWEMRKKNASLEAIANYLNEAGFYRQAKTGKKYAVDLKKLSRIFQDPFYYGVLVQAGQEVDLRLLYDFQPAVSEDDFFYIQRHSRKSSFQTKKAKGFYPLKEIVRCAFCGSNMVVAPSTSGSEKRQPYMYCRCDNQECKEKNLRQKRSCRMKHVFNFIEELLKDGLGVTKTDYERYRSGLRHMSDQELQAARQEYHRQAGILKRVDAEMTERALKIVDFDKGTTVYQKNTERIEALSAEKRQLERVVGKLKKKLAEPARLQLSLDEFLNLSKNAAVKVKAADGADKDAICRLIFLNLDVGNDEVTGYELREPFKTFLQNRKPPNGNVSRGAGNRNRAIPTPWVRTTTILHPAASSTKILL